MNEKVSLFSPCLLYSCSQSLLVPPDPFSRESSGLSVVIRDGEWWSLFGGELSERAAFVFLFSNNGTSCMILFSFEYIIRYYPDHFSFFFMALYT